MQGSIFAFAGFFNFKAWPMVEDWDKQASLMVSLVMPWPVPLWFSVGKFLRVDLKILKPLLLRFGIKTASFKKLLGENPSQDVRVFTA